APIADPTTTNTTDNPLDPYSLTELVNTFPQNLTDYDQSFQMLFTIAAAGTQNITQSTVTLRNTTGGNTVDLFTDVQYKMPTTPTLFDAINGKTSFPAASNTFRVRNGTYVFMQIVNDDNTEHTFHLHGHTFWVTYHGRLLHAPIIHDTVAYPRRDAIQVPPCTGGTGTGGEAGCLKGLLNIVAYFDNPGSWLFHCHVEWHMNTGLMWTINNLDGVTKYASKVPTNLKNFCNTPPV
ncbi:ferroxidase fet3, partial [Blyttiomyces sp. JEL0837]